MLDGVFIGATRTAEMRNGIFIAIAAYLLTLWLFFASLGNQGFWLSMLTFMAVCSAALGLMYPGIRAHWPRRLIHICPNDICLE